MSTKSRLLVIGASITIAVTMGCDAWQSKDMSPKHEMTIIASSFGGTVYRIVDEKAEVICWITSRGGIFCSPMSQTKMPFP